jgi:hypothetical protein
VNLYAVAQKWPTCDLGGSEPQRISAEAQHQGMPGTGDVRANTVENPPARNRRDLALPADYRHPSRWQRGGRRGKNADNGKTYADAPVLSAPPAND